MDIENKRNEITTLIENIKEHSDRLTGAKNIPLLELSAILSKSTKLHEGLLILKFMLENKREVYDEDEEELDEVLAVEEEIHTTEVEAEIEEPSVEIIEEELIAEEETADEEEEESVIEEEPLVEEETVDEEEEFQFQISEEQVEEESIIEEDKEEDLFIEKELSLNEIEQKEELSSKPDVNEVFSDGEDSSLSEQLKKQPIGDLLSAIALNERYLYANELFDGDIEDFRRVMGMLNEFETGDEASQFFNGELRQNYGWEEENEMANALFQLIERRFQS